MKTAIILILALLFALPVDGPGALGRGEQCRVTLLERLRTDVGCNHHRSPIAPARKRLPTAHRRGYEYCLRRTAGATTPQAVEDDGPRHDPSLLRVGSRPPTRSRTRRSRRFHAAARLLA